MGVGEILLGGATMSILNEVAKEIVHFIQRNREWPKIITWEKWKERWQQMSKDSAVTEPEILGMFHIIPSFLTNSNGNVIIPYDAIREVVIGRNTEIIDFLLRIIERVYHYSPVQRKSFGGFN